MILLTIEPGQSIDIPANLSVEVKVEVVDAQDGQATIALTSPDLEPSRTLN